MKSSADDILYFLFSQKMGFNISCNLYEMSILFFFPENKIWYFMQIDPSDFDIPCKFSICTKYQSLSSGKNMNKRLLN